MAEKNATQLHQEVTQFITDNGNNEITAAQLRSILTNFIDSFAKYQNDSYRLGLLELDPALNYPDPVAFIYNDGIYISNAGHVAGENPDAPGTATFTSLGSGGGNLAFNGNRVITRPGDLYGLTIGGANLLDFVENQWFIAEGPGGSVTGGVAVEAGAGTSYNLTVILIKKTFGLVSAELTKTGAATFFGQPVIPADMDADSDPQRSDSQIIPITLESPSAGPFTQESISFNIAISDSDGNVKENSTTFYYRHLAYAGVLQDNGSGLTYSDISEIVGSPPPDAKVLALANQVLTTTRLRAYDQIGGGGFTTFAWPSIFGTPTFIVNGLANNAFTRVRTNSPMVNQHGYSTLYDVWVLDTFQNGPSNIEIK